MWPIEGMRHFKTKEFSYPDLMDDHTLNMLDEMRDQESGIYITINSDYRLGDPRWHGKGKALDLVIWSILTRTPLPLFQQFIIANRYMWTGIRVYPYWVVPGLHVDTRPMRVYGRKAMWMRNEDGLYVSILDWRP